MAPRRRNILGQLSSASQQQHSSPLVSPDMAKMWSAIDALTSARAAGELDGKPIDTTPQAAQEAQAVHDEARLHLASPSLPFSRPFPGSMPKPAPGVATTWAAGLAEAAGASPHAAAAPIPAAPPQPAAAARPGSVLGATYPLELLPPSKPSIESVAPRLGVDGVIYYAVRLSCSTDPIGEGHAVVRRYREWRALFESLPDAVGAVSAPFPPKRLHCALCAMLPGGYHDPLMCAERASLLQLWGQELLQLPGAAEWPQVIDFFSLGAEGARGGARDEPARYLSLASDLELRA